jgi:cupin fold WbuC family metalloprotein
VITLIDDAMLDALCAEAAASPRRRKNRNFHPTDAHPGHRLLNAMQQDSYIPPHRHLDPNKDETFVVLRGSLGVITFDDDGKVLQAESRRWRNGDRGGYSAWHLAHGRRAGGRHGVPRSQGRSLPALQRGRARALGAGGEFRRGGALPGPAQADVAAGSLGGGRPGDDSEFSSFARSADLIGLAM